ncbi:hypothetical protein KYC_15762 [Achromobacter arsenitoxydans SY8]|uniref:Uncharacterized protein n=1 Tax=Achromobacter arsenitoxydans SY8 TaxID=477184 RepID=H0F8Q4_9BURK|nr:hypothetical protein KYC_15762 [Achromobacter arsenitoxydans SY8]
MIEWDFVLNNQPMSKLKGRGLSVDACGGASIAGSTLKAYGIVNVRCGGVN